MEKNTKKKKWARVAQPKMITHHHARHSEAHEDEQIILLKERKRQTLLRIDQLKAQLSDFPRYPYLHLPWQNQDPIVDINEYTKAFHLPERIVPQIHKIDARTTSVQQLELEKKIMENKIADLFQKKTTELNLNDYDEERRDENKRAESDEDDTEPEETITKSSNGNIIISSTKKPKKTKKDKDIMKVFQAERMRLFNENLEKQIEKENYYTMLARNLNEKRNELENLKSESNQYRKEFKANEKHLNNNIAELEENIKQLLLSMADAKNEFVDKLNKKFIMERKNLKDKFEKMKFKKLKKFLEAKNAIEQKLENNPNVDLLEIRQDVERLEATYENQLSLFEIQIMEEETKLYDKINEEEDRFVEFSQREEDNTLEPLKDSKKKQIIELAQLKEKYEEIKLKMDERIFNLENEVKKLEKEKEIIEEENEGNIRIQTVKLQELLIVERDAREKLRKDLENYKKSIMRIREKNLEARYDLSLLMHCHGINRPYVFSYFSEWPFYAMDRVVEVRDSKT